MAQNREVPRDLRKEEQVQLTLRVPRSVHDALKALSHATDTRMNDIGVRALVDFLAAKGHREAVESFAQRVKAQYAVALDKLADL